MATTIITKYGSGAPAASDVVRGELAVDTENKRLYTEDSGGSVVELGTNPAANVTFGDNVKAVFGAGSDLQIYHDGSHSYVKDNGTGNLRLQGATTIQITDPGFTSYSAQFDPTGAATLYHNNSAKLATTSTGIDVTGTVTADGLTVDGNIAFSNASSSPQINSNLSLVFNVDADNNDPNDKGYFFRRHSAAENIAFFDENGDISFYEDTGTTAKLFWDASAESLGIGTSSPAQKLHIEGSGHTRLQITASTTTDAAIYLGDTVDADVGALVYDNAQNAMKFLTNASEAMRIDSSGNLLVGTTINPRRFVSSGSFSSTDAGQPYNNIIAKFENQDRTTNNLSSVLIAGRTSSGSELSLGGFAAQTTDWTDGSTDADLLFYVTSNSTISERMRIDSSGNVGIGTTSPVTLKSSTTLQVDGNAKLGDDNGRGLLSLGDIASTGANAGIWRGAAGAYAGTGNFLNLGGYDGITFTTGNADISSQTERMRIDSSGNLLVGKTSADNTTAGTRIHPNGYASFTIANDYPIIANRLTSDGDIAVFRKDGSTVGSIGTNGGDLFVGTGDTNILFADGSDAVVPANTGGSTRDDAIDLGTSGARFDDIYATNGTIQTSDRNEKQDIEALSDAEQRVAVACKGLLRKFRWKSSVEENGDEARIHFGIIAQDLQAAFEAEGLDAGRYAMFINTTWTDEETGEERSRMGVRYSELLAFIIAAI